MLFAILVFIILLSILVFVHELGHFLTAKMLGIYVEEFGLGLPPRVLGKKIGETIYSINLLPIGGFVKLYGEEDQEGLNKNPKMKNRAFCNRPKLQRALVLVSGVFMNFVLAVIVISYIFTQGVFVPTNKVHIENVISGSPAYTAGLKPSDIILTVNGIKITRSQELINITKSELGLPIALGVERNEGNKKSTLNISITPRKDYPSDQGPMGVSASNLEEKKYPWYQAPILGTKEAFVMSYEMFSGIALILWRLVTFTGVPNDVAGPVGIAQLTSQAVKFGWMAVLQLLGLLSLNLAVVNILPIPALDGGRLLFIIFEKVIGRKVRIGVEQTAHRIGMAFILGLTLIVTINDIVRLLKTTSIGNFFKNLF